MNLIETECRSRSISTYVKASSRMKLTDWKWLERPDSESDDGSGKPLQI